MASSRTDLYLLPSALSSDDLLFLRDEYASVFRYLSAVFEQELSGRLPSKSRRATFQLRLHALMRLYRHIEHPRDHRARKIEDWNRVHHVSVVDRQWSDEQREALDKIAAGLSIDDANALLTARRMFYLKGDPGSGKSEVLVHAVVRAALAGYTVLILCPTGTLVHSYRDRLPASERIVVETIHSSFQITRQADMVVQYSPPSRLRRYDLVLLDEASQVEDHVAQKLVMAIGELPQRPMVCFAADFAQLSPVGGGEIMRSMCERLPGVHLRTIHRSKDPGLLDFSCHVRVCQPRKSIVLEFFRGRVLSGPLESAVIRPLRWMQEQQGRYFAWLCVTNAGANRVNKATLAHMCIVARDLEDGIPGDAKAFRYNKLSAILGQAIIRTTHISIIIVSTIIIILILILILSIEFQSR